jgi:hypothetical protein
MKIFPIKDGVAAITCFLVACAGVFLLMILLIAASSGGNASLVGILMFPAVGPLLGFFFFFGLGMLGVAVLILRRAYRAIRRPEPDTSK